MFIPGLCLDKLHGEELIVKHFAERPRPSLVYELSSRTVKPIEVMAADLGSLLY